MVKFSYKFLGLYTVKDISENNVCTLQSKSGSILKNKYNVSLLKTYIEGSSVSSSMVDSENEDVNKNSNDGNDIDVLSNSSDSFIMLPTEIVRIILIKAVRSASNMIESISFAYMR